MYKIILFTEENAVECVPASWVKGNGCSWPPYRGKRVQNAIEHHVIPDPQWLEYEAKILGQTDSLDKGRRKVKKAEANLSDLGTTDDNSKRNTRPPKRFSSSEATSDEEQPQRKKKKLVQVVQLPPPEVSSIPSCSKVAETSTRPPKRFSSSEDTSDEEQPPRKRNKFVQPPPPEVSSFPSCLKVAETRNHNCDQAIIKMGAILEEVKYAVRQNTALLKQLISRKAETLKISSEDISKFSLPIENEDDIKLIEELLLIKENENILNLNYNLKYTT